MANQGRRRKSETSRPRRRPALNPENPLPPLLQPAGGDQQNEDQRNAAWKTIAHATCCTVLTFAALSIVLVLMLFIEIIHDPEMSSLPLLDTFHNPNLSSPLSCAAYLNTSLIPPMPIVPPCGIAEDVIGLILPLDRVSERDCDNIWIPREVLKRQRDLEKHFLNFHLNECPLHHSIDSAARRLSTELHGLKTTGAGLCDISKHFGSGGRFNEIQLSPDLLQLYDCETAEWRSWADTRCISVQERMRAMDSIPELLVSVHDIFDQSSPKSLRASLDVGLDDTKTAFDTEVQPVYWQIADLLSSINERIERTKDWEWKEDGCLLKLVRNTQTAYTQALYLEGMLHITNQMLRAETVYLEVQYERFTREASMILNITDSLNLAQLADTYKSTWPWRPRAIALGDIRIVDLFRDWKEELAQPLSRLQLDKVALETSKKWALEKFEHCIVSNGSTVYHASQPFNKGFNGFGCAAYLPDFYRWFWTEWLKEGYYPAQYDSDMKTSLFHRRRLGLGVYQRSSFEFYKTRKCFPPDDSQDYCVEYPLGPIRDSTENSMNYRRMLQ